MMFLRKGMSDLKFLTVNPIFWIILVLKLLFAGFFLSQIPSEQFIPFLHAFTEDPFSNVYQQFYEEGAFKAFPYPPIMLWIVGLPFLLVSFASKSLMVMLSPLLLRISLLIADIVILTMLLSFFANKKKLVLWLYWCSPVVFYISYVHGQLDSIPIALLLISLYFLFAKRWAWSGIFLGLGLAAKSNLFIVVPFYALYLWKKQTKEKAEWWFVFSSILVYMLSLLPYLFSDGFLKLVFGASEQLRIFSLSIPFQGGIFFYGLIALYFYLVFKTFMLKRMTRTVFFMMIGISFTFLVSLT